MLTHLPLIIIIIDIFYKDCQIVRTNVKALLDEKQTKRKNKNKKRIKNNNRNRKRKRKQS